MRVVICGPNLNDQSKGQFHVHAKGCADLARGGRREPEYLTGWSIEAASREDIVRAIYADHMAENTHIYDPATGQSRERTADEPVRWEEYDDLYVFPCCGKELAG